MKLIENFAQINEKKTLGKCYFSRQNIIICGRKGNKGSDKRLIRSVDVLPWFHGNVLRRTLVRESQKSNN